MRTEDALAVLGTLESHDLPFYVAGGWGVDALVGRQSRSHDDLDVVLDDYVQTVAGGIDALTTLGYRPVASHHHRAWMSRSTILQDDAGRRVDLVGLNWQLLMRAFGPPGADGAPRTTIEHRVFSEGTMGGRQVPCLSAEVQALYHSDFELTASHRHDIALLHDELGVAVPDPSVTGGMGSIQESALVVLVPAAEATVGTLRRQLDPSSASGVPVHITVLYPFADPGSISDELMHRLDELVASVKPFDFSLSEIGWFGDAVLYVAPTPRAPFLELIERLAAEFPEYPPYGGAYDEVIPNLTVSEHARPAQLRRAARRLERHLPIRAAATEVTLLAPDRSGHWSVERRFPLGGALPSP